MDRPITGGALKVTASVIVVDSTTILRDAAILVRGGIVSQVAPAISLKDAKADKVVHLPGHVLHPGFINVHSHLELSYMQGKLTPGAPFTEWIKELISLRMKTKDFTIKASIAKGVRRLVATGTTCVGDVSQTGLTAPALTGKGLRSVVFHEVLGLDPSLARERFEGLALAVEAGGAFGAGVHGGMTRHGVAPHAVYSTSPALMRMAARYAAKNRMPVSIHLAETPEEHEFCRHGRGPFKEFLLSIGQYHKEWAPGKRPTAAVADTGALEGALVAHFNHPTRGDIAMLKKTGASVAFCPNSNRWFGRKVDHPLPELIRRGVTVGLGTDSLASNADLDMREEMRSVMKMYPVIGARGVFHMATRGGAMALGYEHSSPGTQALGTLVSGAPFDAAAIKLKIGPGQDPWRSIIEARGNYHKIWVDGRPIRAK